MYDEALYVKKKTLDLLEGIGLDYSKPVVTEKSDNWGEDEDKLLGVHEVRA